MVIYNCLRCGYTTHLRSNFKKHLYRKNICKPKLENIAIDEVIKKFNIPNESKMNPKK